MATTRAAFVIIGTIVLAGCVNVSDPISVGPGRYMITLEANSGLQSQSDLLTKSIEKATAFCVAKGLKFNMESNQVSGLQGLSHQSNQVFFTCVS